MNEHINYSALEPEVKQKLLAIIASFDPDGAASLKRLDPQARSFSGSVMISREGLPEEALDLLGLSTEH